ncbi:MAG: UDP-N-acetylmuramoyl-L-alanyl-D-glutamate--2,6-diaminopimelate ligase [Gammaproteobacteria bacterium HGW-Gammaproteobacteria-14]|nr:MAG: UDP-N-acetylmuramoyl-L-alanyl-D-glutamate--2,6-diaminopimelate ligase [Gammaproteobacteria bacterium HGW-Gammaproteobacteria-14]
MMTLQQLLPELPISAAHGALTVKGLSLDSRRVKEGDVFIALSGQQSDGRRYIDAAIHAGAVAVLAEAEQVSEADQGGVPVIGVPQLQAGSVALAAHFYGNPATALTIFGVTGTNGKSSVAWFLRDALNAIAMPCGLLGTLGAYFKDYHADLGATTPDTFTLHESLAAFRDRGARYVSMEVSSHALTQDRLAGVPINVGAFTNLSRDHLDYHGDMDSYFVAKSRLFNSYGVDSAVINTSDAYGRRLADGLTSNIRCVRVAGVDADVRCSVFEPNQDGFVAHIQVVDQSMRVQVPLYGQFNLDNVMMVAGMLAVLGVDIRSNERALSAITPVPGRMQPVRLGNGPTVLVDYAHTPDGLEKALCGIRDHFSGQVWCVVGCGGDRDVGKRPQMAACAEQFADHVIFTSDNPRSESAQSIIADMLAGVTVAEAIMVLVDRPAAVRHAVMQANAEDVVLIAGKGHERWQEVAGERFPMDDVMLARQALVERGERTS